MGLKLRHDTAANWTSANPTLELAELGYETNTGKWKVGDGATAWTSLAYMVTGAGAQPLDSDLTTIAGLTATTDNIIQSVAGAWASRTPAQVKTALAIAESDVTNLVTDLAAKQPLDSDLTTIAGLTATTDNMIQSVGSAWASRTPAQVKTALAIAESDVTNLVTDLAAKAPLASPTFTGTVTLPTGLTGGLRADAGVTSTEYAARLTTTQTTSNSTTETTHWTPANIAAGVLVANQTVIRVRITGNFDNIATSGGYTGRLKVNGTTALSLLLAPSQTGAATLTGYFVDCDLFVDATGVGGTVSAVGAASIITAAGGGRNYVPNQSIGTLVALTTGLQLTWTVQMVTANAGNVTRTLRALAQQVS